MKALDIWLCFKRLHPNTPENPDYSEASVKRWLYHINEAEKNKGFEKVELDLSEIEKMRKSRGFGDWRMMNWQQKEIYGLIAECFPGSQVYACGSQVRGDYISDDICDYTEIYEARKLAGMRVDRNSDFDFWVHPTIKPSMCLPAKSDRYRGKFNEKEMVAIPIYYGDV